MNKIFKIMMGILVLSTVLQCKSNSKADQEGDNPEQEEHSHEDGTVSFTEEQMKAVGITLGTIERKQLTSALKANGILKVPNQNKATINSLYSGTVTKIMIEPGFQVKKGQTIAVINNPELIEVQGQYLNMIAQVTQAEQEVKRQKMLFEGKAGALKNLQAAEASLKTLQNTKAIYAGQIRAMGINPNLLSPDKMISELAVRSPISGTVSKVGVEMGAFIGTASLIAEVIDNSQLHLDLFVYEQDLPKLHKGQTIHFTLTNYPGREYDAEIFSLGNTFEDESKAVSIHARVLGDKTGLIDGMNVTAIISLEAATVTAVPTEAIVSDQGRDYIFIREHSATGDDHGHDEKGDGDEHDDHADHPSPEVYVFRKILVARGTSDIGYTEITLLDEIPEGAQIVTGGAFFVIAKMNDSGGHGHAH